MNARIPYTGTDGLLAGDPCDGESGAAIMACNDYLRMGARRTVVALAQRYKKLQEDAIPTRSLDTLNAWSSLYGWPERARAYDKVIEEARQAEFERATRSGVATVAGRVRDLKWLRNILKEQIGEIDESKTGALRYTNLWVEDVRALGRGEDMKVVYVYKFNAALVSEFRNTLNDLAQEVGGRNVKDAGTPGEDVADREIRELSSKISGILPTLEGNA